MTYIAFGSAKGSPGVTTVVAALAATWPEGRDLLVVEVDPAGGDLAVRFDLAADPGFVTLAAAGRRGLDRTTLLAHTQPLPSVNPPRAGARQVLVGPIAAEQSLAALSAVRGVLPDVLASCGYDVLVDCGRLDPGSLVERLAMQARMLVLVARPVVAEVHHLAARLPGLRAANASLLAVGDKPYTVTEMAEILGIPALGALPDDGRAAQALTVGHPAGLRVLRRSRLLRTAREVAFRLADWLGTGTAPSVPEPIGGASSS